MEKINELFLYRKEKNDTTTIGQLWLNKKENGTYISDTLEDKDRGLDKSQSLTYIRKTKIYGQTAIPTGTYEIKLTWSPRFKKNVPMLIEVKGFSRIYIHVGNSVKDLLGCIAVGKRVSPTWIARSRDTINSILGKYASFFGISVKKVKANYIISSLKQGVRTNITIINDYHD